MNPNAVTGIQVPFLKSAFNEIVLNANRLNDDVAPLIYIPAQEAAYPAAVGNGFISENENGADPRIPQSTRAPAIELVRKFQKKLVSVDIFRRKVTLDRISAHDADLLFDDSGIRAEMGVLADHIADLLEWKIADYYRTSGNYTTTGVAMNFTSLTAGGLLSLLSERSAQVRPSNNRTGSYGLRLVVSPDVHGYIQALLGPVINKDTGFAPSSDVDKYLQDSLGEDILIVSSGSQYNANASSKSAPVKPMWGTGLAAIVAVSDSPRSVEGFVNTIARDQGEIGDNGELVDRFADVYAGEILDPRGTELFIEALFSIGAGDKDRGVKFTVTAPA